MDFAFIVDPLPLLKAYKDTSIAMMRALEIATDLCQRRGEALGGGNDELGRARDCGRGNGDDEGEDCRAGPFHDTRSSVSAAKSAAPALAALDSTAR